MAIIHHYGAEAGRVSANLGVDVVSGSPTAVAPPSGFGHGDYCLRIAPSASTAQFVEWTSLTPATLALGFWLNVDAFGTTSTQDIIQVKTLGTSGASKFVHFGVDTSKKFYFQNAGGTKLVDTTIRAVTDYLWIDLLFDFSGATWNYNWAVNGTPLAAITGDAQVASVVNFIAAGQPNAPAASYTAYMDDFVFGDSASNFNMYSQNPRVISIRPRAGSGINTTSSVNLTQFHNETAASLTADSGVSIAGSPFGSLTRYIAWDGTSPASTDKVVANMLDTIEGIAATNLRAYISMKNADGSTTANTFGVSASADSTTTSIFSGSVASATSKYRGATLNPPTGGWTQSAINGLSLSFGAGSSNNNAGHPALEGAVVEALYLGTTASVTLATRVGTIARDTTGTATSLSVAVPAAVGVGEALIAFIGCADEGLTNMLAPSGWTLQGFLADPTGDGQSLGIFSRTSVSGDAGTSFTFSISGNTGSSQLIGVIVSVYDTATGATIAFDKISSVSSDDTGPTLIAPASPIASSVPAAVLSVALQDQSGGATTSNFTATTDSGNAISELIDNGETGTFLLMAIANESQITGPVSATHTYTYGGSGTTTRGATLASLTVTVASGNVTPPDPPTGLAVTFYDYSQVTLGWTAPADGRAASYNIYRGGVQIGSSGVTSYQDVTVSPSTAYTYAVTSVDSSNNESALSTAVNVTTQATSSTFQIGGLLSHIIRSTVAQSGDTTAPTVPGSVAATAQSSSSIQVTWTASTDNVGVSGYRVRRGSTGSLLSTLGSTARSYTETGLAASTSYNYTVEAFDAAGNTSATSSIVSATTSAASGGTTWATATSYAQTMPAFTPINTYHPTTFSTFDSYVKNAQPGDLIDASGASFTYTGEYILTKSGSAANPIRIILGPNTIFNYTGGANLPALWFKNCAYLQWFDGKFSTNSTGGTCIQIVDSHDCYMWLREFNGSGSKIYNCGGTGVLVSRYNGIPYTYNGNAVTAANYKLNLYFGEITQCGLNLAWDPHNQPPSNGPGTGLHGIQYDDSNFGNYDCTVACNVHDQPSGAAIQIGGAVSTDGVFRNTFYVKANNITDTTPNNGAGAGNGNGSAVQLWGHNILNCTFAYIEASNCAGYAVRTSGMYSGQSLSSDTVTYGVATNCGTHYAPAASAPWSTAASGGPVYQNVTPAP